MSEETKCITINNTMKRFIESGVPKYGGEKPFIIEAHQYTGFRKFTAYTFQASAWWDVDEHMTIGAVLENADELLMCIAAMYDWVTKEWQKSFRNYANKTPETESVEFEHDGKIHRSNEYYSIDNLCSFPYFMAIVTTEEVAETIKHCKLPLGFELYIVNKEGFVEQVL